MPTVKQRPKGKPRQRLFVSSYDSDAPTPEVGSEWIWEPNKPHARERIEVTEVKTHRPFVGAEHWNDLSRFWEAVRGA